MFDSVLKILAPWLGEQHEPETNRLDVVVDVADVHAAVEALLDAKWGYLATITGLDLGPEDGRLEVLYHFCSGALVLTLRVALPRADAEVPTLSDIMPSASVYELELREMLGVAVTGLAPGYLFLPDDWPEAVKPLRKDAQLP